MFPFCSEIALNFLQGTAVTTSSSKTDFYGKFTPKHNTKYVIIGGRRNGGVFYPSIRDTSGKVISGSIMINADGNNTNVTVGRVKCSLEANKEYTFYIPADNVSGNPYQHFAFVVYP